MFMILTFTNGGSGSTETPSIRSNAVYNEIRPTEIVKNKHMICVMQSYLCGRILKELRFKVYWANVEEDWEGGLKFL